MRIGDKVRHMRKVRGATIRQLAETVGVSDSMVSKVERGDIKEPTAAFITAVSEALSIPVEYFLYDEARTPLQLLGSNMPLDLFDFVVAERSMPYIRLAKKAADSNVPEEALNELIAILRKSRRFRLLNPIKE